MEKQNWNIIPNGNGYQVVEGERVIVDVLHESLSFGFNERFSAYLGEEPLLIWEKRLWRGQRVWLSNVEASEVKASWWPKITLRNGSVLRLKFRGWPGRAYTLVYDDIAVGQLNRVDTYIYDIYPNGTQYAMVRPGQSYELVIDEEWEEFRLPFALILVMENTCVRE